MKTANLANQAQRHAEVGQVWEELITNTTGSIEVAKFATFRVRATGASTVTIDGVLAATMSSAEVILFNAGEGDTTDTKKTVTVTIGAVAAFVQVARDNKRLV
jgi:uncharacterized membrane protein YjdF